MGAENGMEQPISLEYLNFIETSKFKRESALYDLFSKKEYNMNTVVKTTFGEVKKNIKKHWKREKDIIRNPESRIGKMKMLVSECVFFHQMDYNVGYYIERFGLDKGDKTEYILRCAPVDPHNLHRGD